MSQTHGIKFQNRSRRPIRVGVEPSGWHFELPAGSVCEIRSSSPADETPDDVLIEWLDDEVTFKGVQGDLEFILVDGNPIFGLPEA